MRARTHAVPTFERHIGPLDRVQLAWYRYLRDDLAAGGNDAGGTTITIEF